MTQSPAAVDAALPPLRALGAPPSGLELWRIELRHAAWRGALDLLSDDERARSARFVFERDRLRYEGAHVALRQCLGRRLGRAPGMLAFRAGPHGKPALTSADCEFNLSHSADIGLLGIAEPGEAGAIGVDIEQLRDIDDLWDLARRHFTVRECDELAALGAAERPHGFLRCWTRKEACLKAVGSGLSIAPETFEAGVAPLWRRVSIDVGAATLQVWVDTLEAGADCVAAWARVQAESEPETPPT